MPQQSGGGAAASISTARPVKQSDSSASTPLQVTQDGATPTNAANVDGIAQDASSFFNDLDFSVGSEAGQVGSMHNGNIWSFDDVDGTAAGSSFPFLQQQQGSNVAAVQNANVQNLSNILSNLPNGVDLAGVLNSHQQIQNIPLPERTMNATPAASTSALSTSRPSGSQLPTHVAKNNPFLNKLRSMVDDPKTDKLIRWSDDGETFLVPNHVRFGDEVLPRFFKHNRFSSFVRQLNMYGFHKVPHLQQGALKSEPGQETELWEFRNDNFKRDKPELLLQMQRKKGVRVEDEGKEGSSIAKTGEGSGDSGGAITLDAINGALTRAQRGEGNETGMMQLATVWAAIQAIQSTQQGINDNLRHLHDTNNQLWREAAEQRARSKKQEETINKMLRFLAGIFGAQDSNNIGSEEARRESASASKAGVQNKGSFIRPYGKSRRRLLIGQGEGSSAGQIEELEIPSDDEEDDGAFDGIDSTGSTPQARIIETFSNNNSPAIEQSPRMRSTETPSTPNPKSGQVRGRTSGQSTILPNISSEAITTPGGGRRVSQQAGVQLLNALASGEAQAWLANLFGQQQQQAGSHTQTPRTRNDNLNSAASGDDSFKLDAQTLAALQNILAAGGGAGAGAAASTSDAQSKGYFDSAQSSISHTAPMSNAISPRQRSASTQNKIARLGPQQQQQLQGVTQETLAVQNALNALVQGLRIGTSGNDVQAGGSGNAGGAATQAANLTATLPHSSTLANSAGGEVDMDSLLKEFFHDPSADVLGVGGQGGVDDGFAGQTPSFAFSPAPLAGQEDSSAENKIQSADTSATNSPPASGQETPTTTMSRPSRKRKPDDDEEMIMPVTRTAAGKLKSTKQ